MMRISHTTLMVLPLLLFTLSSGCIDLAKRNGDKNPEPVVLEIPNINKDSVYSFVQQQVDFGPRVPGSKAHKECGEWMAAKLEQFGAKVTLQPFKAKFHFGAEADAVNIIGKINPEHPRRVLLCAHWDTRHVADQDTKRKNEAIDGADDGASGVAVLLEIARQIQMHPADIGVDIVFFDAEDQGDSESKGDTRRTWCLGAQHWSRSTHRPSHHFKYGILLDMVGSKGARFTKEGTSRRFAPRVVKKVWRLAQDMGYGDYFQDLETGQIVDDHTFVNEIAGIPTIDVINIQPQGFGRYWHTHNDNMGVISKKTLSATGNVVLAVLYNESIGEF